MRPVLKNLKIGFIGAGNMTRSLISGLKNNKELLTENIYVTSRSSEKAKILSEKLSINFVEHTDQILDECDWVVIAIKPQDMPNFLESYGKSFTSDQTVLSLCAGVTLESLKSQLPLVNNFCRLMPSTPAEFGKGVLGVYSDVERINEDVSEYFQSVGTVQIVETEDLLDAIMISAASGPGFMFEILQIWCEWLEEMGFDREQSEDITKASFIGVSSILQNSDKTFVKLQKEVASKKGVTLAGLEAMRSAELDTALNKGFKAALRRSRELSKLV